MPHPEPPSRHGPLRTDPTADPRHEHEAGGGPHGFGGSFRSSRDGAAEPDPFSLSTDPHEPLAPQVAEFPVEDLLRERPAPPRRGWRRAVWRLTGGRVQPAPSHGELDTRALLRAARRAVAGSRTIAVVSTKGGVGKTTTTINLGHSLATFRGDRVVALDANPDAGSLGYRVRRQTDATALDLLAAADDIVRYEQIRSFTSQAPSRLEVVASSDDPRESRTLGRDDYRRLLTLLATHYNLVLADCGTGILDSATRGVVQAADQLVVVTGPTIDAARSVTFLLAWLQEHSLADRVRAAVVVINGVRRDADGVDDEQMARHFGRTVRDVVAIPWDPELAGGGVTGLDALAARTRDAYLRLTASIAEGFTVPERGEAHRT